MLNLHEIVRPAIEAVNPDTEARWIVSTGYGTVNGRQVAQYASAVPVRAQIQPPSGKLLQHTNFLNIQGTLRSVYMYGNPQGVSRVDAKGGDLLQFPQNVGRPVDNWLVILVEEQGWNLDGGSWSKVGVILQTDRPVKS